MITLKLVIINYLLKTVLMENQISLIQLCKTSNHYMFYRDYPATNMLDSTTLLFLRKEGIYKIKYPLCDQIIIFKLLKVRKWFKTKILFRLSDRNFALAHFMKENKCFPDNSDVRRIMDLYCQVFSSVELDFPLSIATFFRKWF